MLDCYSYCAVTSHSGSKHSTLPRFLNKGYQPQTARIRPTFQLELNILRQTLPLLQSTNLCKTFDHSYVRQSVSGILAGRHLRFSTVQSDRNVHIGLP